MRILLTGFDRFGELVANPSQVIVQYFQERTKRLSQDDLVAETLRTEFVGAEASIRHLIRQTKPEAVICLGVAPGLGAISLERIALNLDDTDVPDNAGQRRIGQLIVPDGPIAYWSTLPLEQMLVAMLERGIPAIISNHAGTYVCNHVFYVARHEMEQLGSAAQCGFIHVPLMAEQVEEPMARERCLPFSVIVEAIESCLGVLRAEAQRQPGQGDSVGETATARS